MVQIYQLGYFLQNLPIEVQFSLATLVPRCLSFCDPVGVELGKMKTLVLLILKTGSSLFAKKRKVNLSINEYLYICLKHSKNQKTNYRNKRKQAGAELCQAQ